LQVHNNTFKQLWLKSKPYQYRSLVLITVIKPKFSVFITSAGLNM